PVGCVRIRTGSRRWVTRAGDVTLVARRTRDWVGARAGSRFAGVGLRAGVAVAARCSVGSAWIRAGSRRWVARSGDMTLIARRTRDRVGARACPGLAGVGLGARVAVTARGSVGGARIRTGARRRVARAGDMT